MALTREGRALTERQRQLQLGLRAATIRDILRLMPMWEPTDPASYERFVAAVVALTQARARDAAALAARYYEMFKDVELEGGVRMTWGRAAILAEPPSPQQIRASMDATVKPGYWRATLAGYDRERAMREATVLLTGSMGRHVMNGGRETILQSMDRDPICIGWVRITDGKPCAFCAMLASRGPVYKSAAKAVAGTRWSDTVKDFRAHDLCGCTAQAVFKEDDWPGRSREFEALWRETSRNLTDADRDTVNPAYTAFRRKIEGRE